MGRVIFERLALPSEYYAGVKSYALLADAQFLWSASSPPSIRRPDAIFRSNHLLSTYLSPQNNLHVWVYFSSQSSTPYSQKKLIYP